MIYVDIQATKPEGRGVAGGNVWIETDNVVAAVGEALHRHRRVWDALGHGTIVTYRITVATEASPRRTHGAAGRGNRPLPVLEA